MRKIDKVIFHCSATPEGREVTVEQIRAWHTGSVAKGGRGWKDIGYHYVVYLDGSIHKGRPEEQVGAHTKGQNAHSIGVCYVGGLDKNGRPKDTRTQALKETLQRMVNEFKRRFPGVKFYGHRDFAEKACPCFEAMWYN